MTKTLWTAVGVLLVCGSLVAQDVEQRLRDLESRAARADGLATRVHELEGRLQTYEAADQSAALEASIAALSERQPAAGTVTARKASAITLGGQFRMRGEARSPFNYASTSTLIVPDNIFALMRTRINVDARVADNVRVFAELQDSRYLGEEGSVTADTAGVDLHQGFAEIEKIFGSNFTARLGRTELSLWNQRLVSPLDWHMVGRAWDGLLVSGTQGDFDIAGGWHVVRDDMAPTPAATANTDHLEWAAATFKGLKDQQLGAAFFWLEAASGGLSMGTATLHGEGKCDGFDWSADAAWQSGLNGALKIEAYALAATAGYTFDGDLKPRVSAEWTFGSGDSDGAANGKFETFNPLYSFGHYYQGFMDLFSWKNGTDMALRAEIKPADGWSTELAFHGFWLDTTNDAWYGATGGVIRPASAGASDQLGYEMDLSAKYTFAKNTVLWFGYSRFFAGDFVDATGASDDSDWIWAQLTATF